MPAADSQQLPGELLAAMRQLLDALPTHGAEYALIGGLATGLRSRMRLTDDIDFLVTVPQLRLPGLLDDLKARGFACDTMETIRAWSEYGMVVLQYGGTRVDLLKPMLPLYNHVTARGR